MLIIFIISIKRNIYTDNNTIMKFIWNSIYKFTDRCKYYNIYRKKIINFNMSKKIDSYILYLLLRNILYDILLYLFL